MNKKESSQQHILKASRLASYNFGRAAIVNRKKGVHLKRSEIDVAVQEYLANGGKITTLKIDKN